MVSFGQSFKLLLIQLAGFKFSQWDSNEIINMAMLPFPRMLRGSIR